MNSPDPEHDRRSIIDAMREQIQATPMPAAHKSWLSRRVLARPPLTRPGFLAGAGVALTGLIVGVLLALGAASGPPPAFAATVHSDRTVTITLREVTAVTALNAKLAALQTRIRVVPEERGCVAPVHTVSNGQVIPGPAKTLQASDQGQGAVVTMTIEVNTIPGRTLVVAVAKSGLGGIVVVVVGPAPRCVGYPSAHSSEPFLVPGSRTTDAPRATHRSRL